MSKRNGDKARADRVQKKKLLRRLRNQTLRNTIASNVTGEGTGKSPESSSTS